MRAVNCQKRVLLLGIFRGRNVAAVTLLKIIAPWMTQKDSCDPLHVDFNLLASCEQNLIILWAAQCPHEAGTGAVRAPVSGCTGGGAV